MRRDCSSEHGRSARVVLPVDLLMQNSQIASVLLAGRETTDHRPYKWSDICHAASFRTRVVVFDAPGDLLASFRPPSHILAVVVRNRGMWSRTTRTMTQ